MLTVTMGRSVSVLSIAAAVAVGSATASAQVIITSNGSSVVGNAVGTMVRRAITVSDDSVRSYLTRFEPAVLEDESGDANIVTMVLDNDGTYVRSTTWLWVVVIAFSVLNAVQAGAWSTLGPAQAKPILPVGTEIWILAGAFFVYLAVAVAMLRWTENMGKKRGTLILRHQ